MTLPLQAATGPVPLLETRPPLAWIGYCEPIGTVKICAWCPDKDEADRIARAAGLSVTHGLCPGCYQRQMDALKLDAP